MKSVKISIISIFIVSAFIGLVLLIKKPDCILNNDGKVDKGKILTLSLIFGIASGIIVFFDQCPKTVKIISPEESDIVKLKSLGYSYAY